MNNRRLGAIPLELTELGYGTAALGGIYRAVSDEESRVALAAAWDVGIRYFDTAPGYGAGLAERRLGDFLQEKSPADYVLSTKVGKLLRPTREALSTRLPFAVDLDYGYDGIMRSFEFSLARLGLAHIHLLIVDDLEPSTLGLAAYRRHFPRFLESGMRALEELKKTGEIAAFGLGVNDVGACIDVLHRVTLDCLLLNGRYTLLDRTAGTRVIGMCERSGTPLIVGSLFNGGTLGGQGSGGPKSGLELQADLARQIAENAEIDVGAAAVQFPLRNPLVASALLGTTRAGRIRSAAAALSKQIPEAIWGQFTSSAVN
jgi:D-threo-aldose 1-dehydrogenase